MSYDLRQRKYSYTRPDPAPEKHMSRLQNSLKIPRH